MLPGHGDRHETQHGCVFYDPKPSPGDGVGRLPVEKSPGLYRKFNVYRTDGSSDLHGKHHDCEYLVLDWTHDPYTLPAADAYATACAGKFPELAADIHKRLDSRGWSRPCKPPPPAIAGDVQRVVDRAVALGVLGASSKGGSHV